MLQTGMARRAAAAARREAQKPRCRVRKAKSGAAAREPAWT